MYLLWGERGRMRNSVSQLCIPLDEIAINGKFLDGWTLDDEEDLEDDK